MTDQRDEDDIPIAGIDQLLDAIEAAIGAAPAEQRAALARILTGVMNDYPAEFWRVSPKAAELLHLVLNAIHYASGPHYRRDGFH